MMKAGNIYKFKPVNDINDFRVLTCKNYLEYLVLNHEDVVLILKNTTDKKAFPNIEFIQNMCFDSREEGVVAFFKNKKIFIFKRDLKTNFEKLEK